MEDVSNTRQYVTLENEGIRSHHYELSNKEGATLGMVCGGRNDVLFIPLK